MTDESTINFEKLPVFSMAPDVVARIGFKALGKKAAVISGLLNKIYVWQNRFVPRSVPVKLFGWLIRRAIKNEVRVELLCVNAEARS